MANACTICTHPDRDEIDRAIIAGQPLEQIARNRTVGRMALSRHKAEHLPQVLVKAKDAEEVRQALNVIEQLKAINSATLSVLKEARSMGSHGLQLQAIDRVHKQIELQAKLLGDLDDRPQINILISPQWQQVRAEIMDVLRPYPTARVEVAQRLLLIEGEQVA